MIFSEHSSDTCRLRVHTQADVTALWRELVAEPGFTRVQLLCVCIGESGHIAPSVIAADQLPSAPEPSVLDDFASHVRAAMSSVPRGTAAVLWSRPGRGALRASERAWLQAIAEALRLRQIAAWPPHFANDAHVQIVATEDLAA